MPTTTRRSVGTRKHLLLTKADEARMPALYSTEGKADLAEVIVKFFSIASDTRWYAIEGERTEDGDFRFFGWVNGDFPELGYWTLSELESATTMNGRLPLVERDKYWRPVTLMTVRAGEVS